MRFVEQAVTRPGRCAVFPQIGGNHPRGFFDTGSEMPGFDNHVYVSVVAAESMAQRLGWSSPEDMAEMREQYETLERECARLREEIEDADRFAEAAEYTLNKFNTKVQKKPGRKPGAAKEDS